MKRTPVTPCIRLLRQRGIPFTPLPYAYEDRGGAPDAARKLGLDPGLVVKTLVFEDQDKTPFLVLMHGDREVSVRNLARAMRVRSVAPCSVKDAERYTGYQVGGVSPFGARREMPVYAPPSVLRAPVIYINGGKRGLLIAMAAPDMGKVLTVICVEGIAEEPGGPAAG